MRVTPVGAVVAVGLLLGGCTAEAPVEPAAQDASSTAVEWALVIHGGAGNIPRDMDSERLQAIEAVLNRLRDAGAERLANGADALDVVEEVVVALEDDPLFNAGRGAVLTSERVTSWMQRSWTDVTTPVVRWPACARSPIRSGWRGPSWSRRRTCS